MQQAAVIIGMGEMGGVFARALLKSAVPVYPALRGSDLQQLSKDIPDPALVLLATGESDLQATLQQLPANWLPKLALLQNELLPRDWEQLPIAPSVISVWFEKKPGKDIKVLVSSPVFGPVAPVLVTALQNLGIDAHQVDSAQALLFELVVKNLYILCTNICGLRCGGDVGSLLAENEAFLQQVFDEVLQLQIILSGNADLNREALYQSMLKAFAGDPQHQCMGRSAPQRLQRALHQAQEFGLDLPLLKQIAANIEA